MRAWRLATRCLATSDGVPLLGEGDGPGPEVGDGGTGPAAVGMPMLEYPVGSKYLRRSYLSRMNRSLVGPSAKLVGFAAPDCARRASKMELTTAFPPFSMARTSSSFQESRLTLRTKLIWTPKRRCEPEHSKQQNAPILVVPGGDPGGGTINEAHVGFFSGQSEQI